MAEYEIIDVHLHLNRDTATEKLVFPRPGVPDEWLCGTPDTITPFMDRWGVYKIVSVNAMDTRRMSESRLNRIPRTTPESELTSIKARMHDEMVERFRRFNDWACDVYKKNPRLVMYVGIDPVLFGAKSKEYFEEWVKKGTPGIKIHPGIGGHLPDHPNLMPIYQRCQELGLPVLTDSGASGGEGPGGVVYGEPNHWIPVLSTFPRLKLIMAHFCSSYWDERIILAEKYKDNLVFDISGGVNEPSGRFGGGQGARDGHRAIPRQDAVRVFRKVGIERLMFASDGTGHRIPGMAEQLMALELSDEEKRLIFSGNAKRILGL